MYFFSNTTNFEFAPNSLEHAYLGLLNNDVDTAQKIFEQNDSPRGHWGVTLSNVLKGYIKRVPTYFELRNFLEIDLDFLIKNEKVDYTQLLLGASDIFIQYNQEIYKYIGRVLFTNRYYNLAKEYLDKSKEIIYKDAELHFLLAQYYIHEREYTFAMKCINDCIALLPEYYPALSLKKEISKFI